MCFSNFQAVVMHLACVNQRMSLPEALAASTINSAHYAEVTFFSFSASGDAPSLCEPAYEPSRSLGRLHDQLCPLSGKIGDARIN